MDNDLKRKVQLFLWGTIGLSGILMLVSIGIAIYTYVNYNYATVTL